MPPALHSERTKVLTLLVALLARGGGEVRALFALSRDAIRKDLLLL